MVQVWYMYAAGRCRCQHAMIGSPLLAASKTGDTAAVLALIRAGALVDVTEPIPGLVARQSALVAAANRGHKEVVAALMKAGARDWHTGKTLESDSERRVHIALAKGRKAVVTSI